MSMTIQQAIDNISSRYKAYITCYHQAIDKGFYKAAESHRRDFDAAQIALDALREKAEREDPRPLTLEELRQMDGEPVWIKADHYGTFADVIKIHGRESGDAFVGVKICYRLQENGYGKTWIAYRHKPKEVQK